MSKFVLLDSGPLGLLTYSRATVDAAECNSWLRKLAIGGVTVILPEIIDYEIWRKLLRIDLAKGIVRLESLRLIPGVVYQPITTRSMRIAAEYWAKSRRSGKPTSDTKDLDCDVILAAETSLHTAEGHNAVVATTNPRHLSQFVTALSWREIDAD